MIDIGDQWYLSTSKFVYNWVKIQWHIVESTVPMGKNQPQMKCFSFKHYYQKEHLAWFPTTFQD